MKKFSLKSLKAQTENSKCVNSPFGFGTAPRGEIGMVQHSKPTSGEVTGREAGCGQAGRWKGFRMEEGAPPLPCRQSRPETVCPSGRSLSRAVGRAVLLQSNPIHIQSAGWEEAGVGGRGVLWTWQTSGGLIQKDFSCNPKSDSPETGRGAPRQWGDPEETCLPAGRSAAPHNDNNRLRDTCLPAVVQPVA